MTKEEVYYTVSQAQKLLSVSKPTVYEWADKGIIKRIENSDPQLFVIPTDLIERRSKLSKVVNKRSESVLQLNESSLQEENVNSKINSVINNDNELILTLLNRLDEKNSQLVEYAESRGQVKLLTDDLLVSKEMLKELKEESKLYQERYFELRLENEQLKKGITELESQLNLQEINSVKSDKIVENIREVEGKVIKKSGLFGFFKK